jgi:predicted RNA polymerase sigma factor
LKKIREACRSGGVPFEEWVKGREGPAPWERVAALYRVLAHVSPSPVVELNRAVAVAMAGDPARAAACA